MAAPRQANFFLFLFYPGLCLRWVKLCKPTELIVDGASKQYLTEDLQVEYMTGRHKSLFQLFLVIGPLFVLVGLLLTPLHMPLSHRPLHSCCVARSSYS